MNRLQFFSEMKKGLVNTVKEISYPILSEKVERIEHVVDHAQGLHWFELGEYDPKWLKNKVDFHFAGQTIHVYSDGDKLYAVTSTCPHCHADVRWVSYERTFKCLSCDLAYHTEDENNRSLTLTQLPVKEEDGCWHVGIHVS